MRRFSDWSLAIRRHYPRKSARIAGNRPVWAGIGANRLSQRETLDDIGVARRAGAQGIILFSYDSLISPPKGTDYLSALGRGAFAGL